MSLNIKLFYFFNHLAGQNGFIDSLIIFIAEYLPWILIIFTIVYFLFFRKSVKKLFVLIFTTGVAALVTQFLKWQIFLHPRPFAALPDVVKLVNINGFASFPSGHATVFAALATGMFIYNRKLGTIFMIAALLIGMARVAAGIHYPLDILTGYAIGFVMTILAYRGLGATLRAARRFAS